MTIPFETLHPDTAHRYFKHWVSVLETRNKQHRIHHDRYGRKLPEILITPPSKKDLAAGHKLVVKKFITEQAALSPKVKKLIESQYTFKMSELERKHEEKVVELKKKIHSLESETATLLAELNRYKRKLEPHTMTKKDVSAHITALETKLAQLDKKSQTYHDLAERLDHVKERLLV